MDKLMKKLVAVGLMLGLAVSAGANIIVGDFSAGNDGWSLIGNAENPENRSMERILNNASTAMALRLNYIPTGTGTDLTYPGWVGIFKAWDATGQVGVTQLTIPVDSNYPWVYHVLASFEGVGEIDSGWTFWPNGTYTYTAANFGVTAEQFNKINGVRLTMDAASATNGGGGNPMWVQVYDVSLNGVVPEPASLGLLALGGLVLAQRRRGAAAKQ